MTWISNLAVSYDSALDLDILDSEKPVPIFHTTQTAHINVIVDAGGNFIKGIVLDPKFQVTLPASLKSAGRTSGKAAHGLADTLRYVANDYAKYTEEKVGYYDEYINQLDQWCNSEFSHPSVEAVRSYVSKGSVISDLIAHRIIWLNDRELFLERWEKDKDKKPPLFKILPVDSGKIDQSKALVCWSVERLGEPSGETWLDSSLQRSWINFENSRYPNFDTCYVSGEVEIITQNHPSRMRYSGDRSKLISSNDWTGYTFRGRFTDSGRSDSIGIQAVNIGAITTQKAHNALRWLIGRQQSYRNDDQVIVTWAVSGKDVPTPHLDRTPFDFEDFGEEETESIPVIPEHKPDHSVDLGQSYARKLKKYITGYQQSLEVDDTVSLLSLDSASPGRMAITMYREFVPQDYLNQISCWYDNFAWFQLISVNGRPKHIRSAPIPWMIMQAVYGDSLKGQPLLEKKFFELLIPTIVEGVPIQRDFVQLAFNNARNPAGKEEQIWKRNLGVACSLYRGFHFRHPEISKRKEFSMSLDQSNRSRDYLYGRLLAIAERLEEIALYVANVNRGTTAIRLMVRFSDRPYTTWLLIYKQLNPYMQQLRVSRAEFLAKMKRELDHVTNLFCDDEFRLDDALSGEFLLGYHAQRLTLRGELPDSKAASDEDADDSTIQTEE